MVDNKRQDPNRNQSQKGGREGMTEEEKRRAREQGKDSSQTRGRPQS